ncbi:MAG TPA: toxin-antitoxin system YwqK family antitoxin [Saprospiraceae bacterium]|nr:toxin-antitoxin system YwqK family antitoxin [Saprospiraceae bacterium]
MAKAYQLLIASCLLFFSLLACTDKKQEPNTTDEVKVMPMPAPEVAEREEFELRQMEETDFEGNVLQYAIINSTGERHGRFLKRDETGNLLEEAEYLMGNLDGNRILYYPNQDTMIVESHVNGQFQGDYRTYHPGNQLKLEGTYIDNKMQGTWKMYYETGELKEEVTFVNNLENGPFVEYHKNGQIAVTGTYLNGDNEHGVLKFYDESGQHYKSMECNEGLCRTTWKLEDEIQ